MDQTIMLKCRACGRTQQEWRVAEDPPNAALCVCICDRCKLDGRNEYFDAAGAPIPSDLSVEVVRFGETKT